MNPGADSWSYERTAHDVDEVQTFWTADGWVISGPDGTTPRDIDEDTFVELRRADGSRPASQHRTVREAMHAAWPGGGAPTIYLQAGSHRFTLYPEGGVGVEIRIPDAGWVVNDNYEFGQPPRELVRALLAVRNLGELAAHCRAALALLDDEGR